MKTSVKIFIGLFCIIFIIAICLTVVRFLIAIAAQVIPIAVILTLLYCLFNYLYKQLKEDKSIQLKKDLDNDRK